MASTLLECGRYLGRGAVVDAVEEVEHLLDARLLRLFFGVHPRVALFVSVPVLLTVLRLACLLDPFGRIDELLLVLILIVLGPHLRHDLEVDFLGGHGFCEKSRLSFKLSPRADSKLIPFPYPFSKFPLGSS